MKTKKIYIVLSLFFICLSFWIGRNTGRTFVKQPATTETVQVALVDAFGENIDWGSPAPKQPTIADMLRNKGVDSENISYFEFVGDESSYTYGRVKTDDKEEIDWVWSMIFEYAEPYSFWVPSGYRRMNIYLKNQKEPAAKLFVNETEATSIEGIEGRFMCHGLEEYILSKLPKRD